MEKDPITAAIEQNSKVNESVFVMSTGTGLLRSVVQADRIVASKYFPDFPIAFSLVNVEDGRSLYDPDALPPSLKAYLSDIEGQIQRQQPDLIAIDGTTSCSGCQRI